MRSLRILSCAVLLAASALAQAYEYKSIGASPAVLYAAPNPKAAKLYIAPRGMPVEVVLTYLDWSKVRDANGDLAWTESRSLSPRRNVVVRVNSARVRATAEDNAPVVMTADKGVLLELLEASPAPWAKVKHRDGIIGYVKTADIWGV
jgi:SH3-like domain-containing protein